MRFRDVVVIGIYLYICVVKLCDIVLKLLLCALYKYFVRFDVTRKNCVKYRYLRKGIFTETKKEKKNWMLLTLFSDKNYRFSHWEITFFFGRSYVMYCSIYSSSVSKGSMGRRPYYPTETKVSDNEIRFKWLFRLRCFIIKRNNCGKIGTPVYMPHMLYFERLTIGGVC